MPTNIPPAQLPAWITLLEELANGLARHADDDHDLLILRWNVTVGESAIPATMGFGTQLVRPEASMGRMPLRVAAREVWKRRSPALDWYPRVYHEASKIAAQPDAIMPIEAVLQCAQQFEHLLFDRREHRKALLATTGLPDPGLFPHWSGAPVTHDPDWKPWNSVELEAPVAMMFIADSADKIELLVATHEWALEPDGRWVDGRGLHPIRRLWFCLTTLPRFCRTAAELVRAELVQARVAQAMAGSKVAPVAPAPHEVPKPPVPAKLPSLPKHAAQAWQLHFVAGRTQTEIAQILNEKLGTKYKQGQISRMISVAKQYAEQGRLADLIPSPAEKAASVDPSKIDLGERTDGRRRPRRPSTQDD